MPPGLALALALALGCLSASGAARADVADDELWARLARDGHVVLLRHARAPGTQDPPGFALGDCSTQRNLSAAGREQARRLGEAVRARQVKIGRVLSSRWCRAKDTAALAFGSYQTWADLDYFVGGNFRELPQRAARIREAIGAWSGPGTLFLVSHQLVISEVVGRPLAEAAMIVVGPRAGGGFAVLGSIPPPD